MNSCWQDVTTETTQARKRAQAGFGASILVAAMLTVVATAEVSAQQVNTPPAAAPPQTASPPPRKGTGLLNALSDWFNKSVGNVNSSIKGARDTITNFGGKAEKAAKGAATTTTNVAKGAADTIVRLPGTRMVDGRVKCALAPNGAPDCYAAAEALCRSNGFKGGKSVETQSAQKCSAQVWLSGRSPRPGECKMEHFVTRALCS